MPLMPLVYSVALPANRVWRLLLKSSPDWSLAIGKFVLIRGEIYSAWNILSA